MSIKGMPISSGIAIGKAFVVKQDSSTLKRTEGCNKEMEKNRFHDARQKAIEQVETIYEQMAKSKGEEEAEIFIAQIEMLKDRDFIRRTETVIEELGCNAEWAVKKAQDDIVEIFEAMDNDYMRERALDIKDISGRVIRILQGHENALSFKEPVIMIAHELTPSDTVQMNPDLVLGIINEAGGSTSHAAIIARMLGIPFIVSPQIVSLIQPGQIIAMDGDEGRIELLVDDAVLEEYGTKQKAYKEMLIRLEQLKGTKSVTKDGFEIQLAGNIGSPKDIDRVLQQDAHSIGLFRTEFLYMNRKEAPQEEEQFAVYKEVAERMQGNPVVIRTLDIGGDKQVDYLNIPKEDNPFLGFRAIRLCLSRKSLWKVQLRALLRASAFGHIHIMFPMIASMDELSQAKELLEETKAELRGEGIAFKENIPVGMMMETPAAAVMADVFAKEVDFFSIGTNDLVQYTMATDRMNTQVAHLYSPYDPAVIRLIKKIADSSHENNIWTGICGEAAADKKLIPLWVALKIEELSMSPDSVLKVRGYMQKLSSDSCEKLLDKVLELRTAREVEAALDEYKIEQESIS
jgi:phosphotransferase system enzyme I (PtsI)